MKLNNALCKENYVYSERYLNNFKKVENNVSKPFCAMEGVPFFVLPHVELPRSEVKIITSHPDRVIYSKLIGKNVKFFIHPDMIEEIRPKGLKWEYVCEPTSSTRTIFLKGDNFFVKLHLNRRLSRFIRRLRPNSVKHSVAVSRELEIAADNAPSSFAYLPESIGIIYRKWGMIVRERMPHPIVKENRNYVPLFSLYANDLLDKKHVPLFVQLIKMKKENPLNFFIKYIVRPLFANVSHVLNTRGILLEPHGQNVLVEFDSKRNITRLIHRDFQSMYVDEKIRKKNKLRRVFHKHIMGRENTSEVSYSLVYDNYIGRYLFNQFANLMQIYWGIPSNTFAAAIRKEFKKFFSVKIFPTRGFYMMHKKRFIDNKTRFHYCPKKPRYR